MFGKAFLDLARGLSMYKVWLYQAYHEISKKYKRTFLGSLWIAGSMVTTSLCLSLVFGALMGQDLHEVLPYIMGGILCFSLISFVLNSSPELFIGSAGMIRNHAYPFTYYVLEETAETLLTFLHNLVVYYIALLLVGALRVPHWSLVFAMPIVVVTMVSWGTVVGMISARYRDLRFMMPYLSQLTFYITPIFWRVEHNKRALISDLNPVYGLLEIMRSPLMGNAPPQHCWTLAIIAMTSGIVAWLVAFPPFRRRIAFWV